MSSSDPSGMSGREDELMHAREFLDKLHLPYDNLLVREQLKLGGGNTVVFVREYEGQEDHWTEKNFETLACRAAADYFFENGNVVVDTLRGNCVQYAPHLCLLLYMMVNDMSGAQTEKVRKLVWAKRIPFASQAISPRQRFFDVVQGYMKSALCDNPDLILRIVRKATGALDFWTDVRGELSSVLPRDKVTALFDSFFPQSGAEEAEDAEIGKNAGGKKHAGKKHAGKKHARKKHAGKVGVQPAFVKCTRHPQCLKNEGHADMCQVRKRLNERCQRHPKCQKDPGHIGACLIRPIGEKRQKVGEVPVDKPVDGQAPDQQPQAAEHLSVEDLSVEDLASDESVEDLASDESAEDQASGESVEDQAPDKEPRAVEDQAPDEEPRAVEDQGPDEEPRVVEDQGPDKEPRVVSHVTPVRSSVMAGETYEWNIQISFRTTDSQAAMDCLMCTEMYPPFLAVTVDPVGVEACAQDGTCMKLSPCLLEKYNARRKELAKLAETPIS